MRFSAIVLLASAAACAPVVTHSPRVEPGVTLYGTMGGSRSLCSQEACDTDLVPQMGGGARYGRVATDSTPGFSVGFTYSAGFISSEVDLYVQAPASQLDLDAGAGVLAAGSHVMPYVQLGRMRPDGSGWYTTQGFAWMAERAIGWTLDDPLVQVTPRYWAPAIAYRTRGRYGVHVYASGALGSARVTTHDPDESAPRTERQPVRAVLMGVVFDVQTDPPPGSLPPARGAAPAVPPPPGQPR
ncbi:hypothetical protein [Longimicrobium sp.]|jgi:hypothetical protein|uniref:hypothetical protein n=1 Tax=Longimicrobium sp. TaxID=2029185 RepID=UPI002ED93118